MKRILNFLGSAKLGIVLFFLIAILSILGTIVPQGQPPQFYLLKYGETLGRLLVLFQLDDVYHSLWYVALLFLFLFNLVICSYNRYPIVLRLYKKNPEEVDINKLPNSLERRVQVEPGLIVDKLKKQGFKEASRTFEKGVLLYKNSCRWGYFAFYLVHLSMVLIVLGAMVGAIWGFRGNLALIKGGVSNQVSLFREEHPVFLDFSVRLNQFTIELYPNGMPKEYISNVTIIDKDKEFDALIKVNAPLNYKGITFYQASYEEVPRLALEVLFNGKKQRVFLEQTFPVIIEDRLAIFLEAYMEHPNFLVAKFLLLDIKEEKEHTIIAIKDRPVEIKTSEGRGTLILKGMEKDYLSILQVKRDPGVWIVYAGFVMMILGLLGVYLGEPKTFWVFIQRENKGTLLKGGALAKRDRNGIALKLRKILDSFDKKG